MKNVYELAGVRPTLGEGVWIAPTAAVVADVVLGAYTSVWFGAVLRGDCFPIRVGARTNVQDNAVVHVTAGAHMTTIGDEVTIGHAAVVHGCTLENRVLVGMGAIVLDGAVVGTESMIAAGALVTPGTVIPPRSMVMGRPGRVVRPLRSEEIAGIAEAAEHYVAYAAKWR